MLSFKPTRPRFGHSWAVRHIHKQTYHVSHRRYVHAYQYFCDGISYLPTTPFAITFHDRVKHPRFEAQHHVETRHVRTLDILKPLWSGFDRSVTGRQVQKIILEEKRLVLALQRVVEVPKWRSEREYFRAGDVLAR